MVRYFEQGDIIYMDFNPQSGHEQAGRRPAIVVSSTAYNSKSNMTMVCPITNTIRRSPVHAVIKNPENKTTGNVLCDQAKFLDLNTRNAVFSEKAAESLISEVIEIIQCLIERDS